MTRTLGERWGSRRLVGRFVWLVESGGGVRRVAQSAGSPFEAPLSFRSGWGAWDRELQCTCPTVAGRRYFSSDTLTEEPSATAGRYPTGTLPRATSLSMAMSMQTGRSYRKGHDRQPLLQRSQRADSPVGAGRASTDRRFGVRIPPSATQAHDTDSARAQRAACTSSAWPSDVPPGRKARRGQRVAPG